MAQPNSIVTYKGVRCSLIYERLLNIAAYEGVKFTLDSGYRSIAEQWVLWYRYKRGQGPIAAFPGTSTHNKRGWKQGLDINSLDGGTQRFIQWAKVKGMTFNLTVVGEAWHVNAAADYTHRIFTMWHEHLAQIKRVAITQHQKLEEDRQKKLHGK